MRTAYRAVLRREPSQAELLASSARTLKGALSGDRYFRLLRDMVESREFRTQILPGLVVTGTGMASSEPIFFLHIPKTGGTSLRLVLGDAIGVPAINLYRDWPLPDRNIHGYWPYWAGHAQIDFFPTTHTGFTVFRESRSRVLSSYRQRESMAGRVYHGWEYGLRTIKTHSGVRPFAEWLERLMHRGEADILRFLTPTSEAIPSRIKPPVEAQKAKRLSETHAIGLLRTTLPRFGAAAWIHDEPGVLAAITKVTGKEVSEIPRENTFEGKRYAHTPVVLNERDRELLEDVARRDRLVFTAAEDLGLISPLDADEADALFERTAARLDFKL